MLNLFSSVNTSQPLERAKSFDTSVDNTIHWEQSPYHFADYIINTELQEQWLFLKDLTDKHYHHMINQSDDTKRNFNPDIVSLLEYINLTYDMINRATSNRLTVPLTQEIFNNIMELDRLYDLVPKTRKEFIVYRCYAGSQLPPYERDENNNLLIKSFLSTSVSKNFILTTSFCRGAAKMIAIKVLPGSNVLPIVDHYALQKYQQKILSDVDGPRPQLITEYEIMLDQYGSLKPLRKQYRGCDLYEYIQPTETEREDKKVTLYTELIRQLRETRQPGGTKRQKDKKTKRQKDKKTKDKKTKRQKDKKDKKDKNKKQKKIFINN